MDLFVSRYFNKIDKKGRVSFPSSFRNSLPKSSRNEIILYKSIKTSSIEGCGIQRLEEIAKRINNLDFFSEEHNDFSTSIFSEIIPTNIDKEGRFLIPEELKNYANIKSEAAFFVAIFPTIRGVFFKTFFAFSINCKVVFVCA